MLWRAFSMVASQKAAMQSGFTCAKTWTMNMGNLPYKRSDTQERNWQSDGSMRASQRGKMPWVLPGCWMNQQPDNMNNPSALTEEVSKHLPEFGTHPSGQQVRLARPASPHKR